MESWNLNDVEVDRNHPQVLDTQPEGRSILLALPAGKQLQEHQVHERAWLLVVEGEIEVTSQDGGSVTGSAGLLVIFGPKERHEVTARSDARLLLILSPWPGDGHPSQS
jgi:quercetin dioxygenase-like cupin family protein